MTKGIGVDLAEVSRFRSMDCNLLGRLFTENELRKASGRVRSDEYLASRFAAKEALSKAVGTGVRGFTMLDIEIDEEPSGRPYFILSERFRSLFPSLSFFLSISHEGGYACAMVVADEV